MKRYSFLTALIGAAIGFLAAFCACGCMASGFALEWSYRTAAVVCAVCAAAGAACFTAKKGWVLALGFALSAGYLARSGIASRGAEALVRQISRYYNGAYGWGLAAWSSETLSAADTTAGLCMVGALVAVFVVWTLCGRCPTFLSAAIAVLPLAACLVVTDTAPAERWLFGYLLGMLLLLLTRLCRKQDRAQGALLAAMLSLPAALALALLFSAVPKEGYAWNDYFGGVQRWVQSCTKVAQDASGELTLSLFSGAQRVKLTSVGPKSASSAAVMDVTSEKAGGMLYLRGSAYGEYDGKTWYLAEGDWTQEDFIHGAPIGTVTVSTRSVHDTVYFPYVPQDLSDFGTRTQGGVRNDARLREYTLTRYADAEYRLYSSVFIPFSYTPPVLEEAVAAQYRALPDETRTRAQAILDGEKIFASDGTSISTHYAADRIRSYVLQSASYSLSTARMPGGETDFALWFLEESDTGYCVHFATAATVLLRAAGVPARYVTGYLVEARAGETVTVRARDAHAWVEYFLPGSGWTVLEATPSVPLNAEPETTAPTAARAETAPSRSTEQPVLPLPSGGGGESPSPAEPSAKLPSGVWFVLAAAAAAAILLAQASLRRAYRRRKQRTGSAAARGLARWREARTIAKCLREKPDEAMRALALKAKYSRDGLTDAEIAQFDALLAQARARLREKPLPLRILCRLIFAEY